LAKEKVEQVVVDMSSAVTMELLPERVPYLAAISGWKLGKSGAGNRKLTVEITILKPDTAANAAGGVVRVAKRKLRDDISLDNENTLGRAKLLLRACGKTDEELNSKKFIMPNEDEMMGQQITVWARTQAATDQFEAQSKIGRVRPPEAFKEAAESSY
jgi:hypothetical protein